MPPDPLPELTVHHLNNSRSQRVLWLIEELDVPYTVVHYQRDPKTMLAPRTLRTLHPLGKSPVVTIGGKTIAETGLIIEYLCGRYDDGRLSPPAEPGSLTEERERWLYWMHYAEGSLMPMLLLKLVFSRMPRQSPRLLRFLVNMISKQGQQDFIDPQLEQHLDYLETCLDQGAWFGGSGFSAADIMMSFPLEAADRFGLISKRTKLSAFLARAHQRPAYRRALERGGPYAMA